MELNKPRILILTDWYLPALKAGGPVKSVSAIVDALKTDCSISIITTDRDFGSTEKFDNIESDVWVEKDGYRILYSSPYLSKDHIIQALRDKYHKVYLNSLFSRNFTITPLRLMGKDYKKRVILAPRGMLGEGALALKSFKKKAFLKLARLTRLYHGVTWHASSNFEELEIKKQFPSASIKVLENLSKVQVSTKAKAIKEKGRLKLVFVSRISPKKNLLFALNLLKDRVRVELDIYGPVEDEVYWNKCKKVIEVSTSKIEYRGTLTQENLTRTLENYHVFILPTLNENFGHVILEAFAAGLPVIISDQTPWQNLSEKKLGEEISLDEPEKWYRALDRFLEMEAEKFQTYRTAAIEFAREKANQNDLIGEYKKLFGVLN